jgi:predicted RNA-binding protein YlqC (UPF0109 family)
MVSAKEEPDLHISPAMEALLKVHKCLVDVDADSGHATSGSVGTVITRILVADTQAGSLIGKQGSSIKSIQDASNCTIRVLGSGILAKHCFPYESVISIFFFEDFGFFPLMFCFHLYTTSCYFFFSRVSTLNDCFDFLFKLALFPFFSSLLPCLSHIKRYDYIS